MTTPPLPPGFSLVQDEAVPPLPAGFSLVREPVSEQQFSLPAAIADVPTEIASAFKGAAQRLSANSIPDQQGYDPRTRAQLGPLEGLVRTGKQALAVPELITAPIVGAARSMIGHPMADVTQAIGSVINPEVAAKQDPKVLYETAKGDVDLAMTGARAPVAKAPNKPVPAPVPAPSVAELKAAGSAGFESPVVSSLEVTAPTMRSFGEIAKVNLSKQGFDPELTPEVFNIIGRFEKAPEGAYVTGSNIQTMRRVLGKAAESSDATKRAAATAAIDELDEFLPTIAQNQIRAGDLDGALITLRDARANWSAAKHAEMLDQKMIQAELRAAAANSGRNVSNTIRQRMADILIDPKKRRGFSDDALEQMRTIVEGTGGQNALRFVGNIAGGGGGLGTLAASAAGVAATGGLSGFAVPAAGFAMRALSNRMTLKQAERLSEMVRSNSPLASSMAKFEEAAVKASSGADAKAIAGALIAARNLSTNLRSAGLNFSPSELLSGFQSPGSGNANQKQ